MMIWINGAFGSGKTHAAHELAERLAGSYVYDPENAGFFIRDNLPAELQKSDFQEHSMWREFNLRMLGYIADSFHGDIIVPMTVTERGYYDELIGALSERYDVRHYILCATRETLLKRLSSRFEGKGSWAARQIDRCIRAFDESTSSENVIPGIRLQTDSMTVSEVVCEIARSAGLTISKRPLSPLRHILTTLKAVRFRK